MARLFQKAQSEIQQEAKKPNMMKKYGVKFKQAFSKKKQSLAQTSNEACVQEVSPATTTLPKFSAKEREQLSSEQKGDAASTDVSVDEGTLVLHNTSQGATTKASQKVAVTNSEAKSQDVQQLGPPQLQVGVGTSTPLDPKKVSSLGSLAQSSTDVLNTGLCTIRRFNSVPASPTSSSSGASSDTLNNTPTHSVTSSSPSLTKFRQAMAEHTRSSGKCHRALAEHIQWEEKEKENIEWVALMEWTKIGHQSELRILEKKYAAEVVQLQKQRSEARRSLELRNRELRAMKREMRRLNESLEEAAKDQEEKQPAHNPHPAEQSDAESVDQDEGGVLLTNDNAVPAKKVHDKETANEGKQQAMASKKETAEEKQKRQQALKQQLMEDSIPEASSVAEAGPSAPTQKTTAIMHHQRALQAIPIFARDVIDNLQVDAEAMEEEIKVLKAQNHFAQLEVGHCHAANACYRDAAEDDNPARTAHLDGLLKRKDEAYVELEERAAECAKLLAEEKKQRAIEKEYSEAEIRGMHKELAHRFKVIEALTEGRDVLKAQNDWVFQMFQGKIFHNDVIEAFLRDYHVIQKDNSLLIKMIKEHQCYMVGTEKQLADLRAEKIANDHAAHVEYLEHRQTQQSLNGLTYVNSQLNAKIDFQDEIREELKVELEGRIQTQAAEIEQILLSGADNWLIQRQQAQDRQIDSLNAKITEYYSIANQWRTRSIEQDDRFCPLNNYQEVADFHAEETRWRLTEAERQVVRLQRVVREMDKERKGKAREQQVVGDMSGDRKGKGKEREMLEVNGDSKGKGKEKEVLEIGHDGSNWLRDRAEEEKVREKYRWM